MDSTAAPLPERSALVDAGRLAALHDLGLTEQSDPGMERYAERVREQLSVPVSLVSFVQADQQVFPGMSGLPDPWASRRATPLSHSFCQHVVVTGEPLIVEDARLAPLVRDNLATVVIGVVGYAGMPLTDDHGHVLGSLCAIDTEPRAWTDREIAVLRDIAKDCSNEIRLRLSRLDADRERERRDAIDVQLQQALQRSQQLLAIAEVLNTCGTVADVRQALAGFAEPAAGLIEVAVRLAGEEAGPVDPTSLVVVEDVDAPTADLDDEERATLQGRGARAVAYLPLRGSGATLGRIELLWDVPRVLAPEERATAAALAAYAGQALERAILIEDRIHVAHELQNAMLADLPDATGLDLAACYLPAMADERVGGDWYDAFSLPGPDASLLVSVGDITGHDIAAATVMGQVRAMLRQAAWDRPTAPPSEHLAGLEQACDAYGIPASGTAVLARFSPVPGSPSWQMTWVNAGHPPPLVVEPGGAVRLLTDHDLLFGYPDLGEDPRADHHLELAPGTTVVLYTDGITDDSAVDPDAQVDALVEIVRNAHDNGARAVVGAIADRFSDMSDDVVSIVLRIPS